MPLLGRGAPEPGGVARGTHRRQRERTEGSEKLEPGRRGRWHYLWSRVLKGDMAESTTKIRIGGGGGYIQLASDEGDGGISGNEEGQGLSQRQSTPRTHSYTDGCSLVQLCHPTEDERGIEATGSITVLDGRHKYREELGALIEQCECQSATSPSRSSAFFVLVSPNRSPHRHLRRPLHLRHRRHRH